MDPTFPPFAVVKMKTSVMLLMVATFALNGGTPVTASSSACPAPKAQSAVYREPFPMPVPSQTELAPTGAGHKRESGSANHWYYLELCWTELRSFTVRWGRVLVLVKLKLKEKLPTTWRRLWHAVKEDRLPLCLAFVGWVLAQLVSPKLSTASADPGFEQLLTAWAAFFFVWMTFDTFGRQHSETFDMSEYVKEEIPSPSVRHCNDEAMSDFCCDGRYKCHSIASSSIQLNSVTAYGKSGYGDKYCSYTIDSAWAAVWQCTKCQRNVWTYEREEVQHSTEDVDESMDHTCHDWEDDREDDTIRREVKHLPKIDKSNLQTWRRLCSVLKFVVTHFILSFVSAVYAVVTVSSEGLDLPLTDAAIIFWGVTFYVSPLFVWICLWCLDPGATQSRSSFKTDHNSALPTSCAKCGVSAIERRGGVGHCTPLVFAGNLVLVHKMFSLDVFQCDAGHQIFAFRESWRVGETPKPKQS